MYRVIAIVACGLTVAACTSSSWMPSIPGLSDGSLTSATPVQVSVTVESNPPGADAKSSAGASCRTPCALALQGSGDSSVSVSLNGYIPQNVPVKVLPPEDPRFGGIQNPRVDPSTIYVELEKAPPPPAAKKPARRPAAARARAPQPAAAAEASAPAPAPMGEPAGQAAAPWPMPR